MTERPTEKVFNDTTNTNKNIRKKKTNSSDSNKATNKNNTAQMKASDNSRGNSNRSVDGNSNKKKNNATGVDNEAELRKGVLEFYKSQSNNRSSFCKQNGLSDHQLRKRWSGSGLKNLKESENRPSCSDAMIQYDAWFKKWKE